MKRELGIARCALACLGDARPALRPWRAASFLWPWQGKAQGAQKLAVPLGKLQSAAVGFGNLPYQLQAGAVGGGSRRQGRLLLGRGILRLGGLRVAYLEKAVVSLLPQAYGDAAAVRVVADAVLHQIGQGAVQQGAVGL